MDVLRRESYGSDEVQNKTCLLAHALLKGKRILGTVAKNIQEPQHPKGCPGKEWTSFRKTVSQHSVAAFDRFEPLPKEARDVIRIGCPGEDLGSQPKKKRLNLLI